MVDLAATIKRLCNLSIKAYTNPYAELTWPASLALEQWFISPELISLYGTAFYEGLTEAEKKRLSFYEAVNFFSLNIHGEKFLIAGLAKRLYRRGNNDLSSYLHHFLDEENKHMVYFGGFCLQYAGKVYADRQVALPRDYAPGEEDFLFFAKVLIFEELVAYYNVKMARDPRLVGLARQINALHHRDEARHLVFGRQVVKVLFDRYVAGWSQETLCNVRDYLSSYFIATWKTYYNPDVYRDAGLSAPYQVREAAFAAESSRIHRKRVSHGCIQFLLKQGMIEAPPLL